MKLTEEGFNLIIRNEGCSLDSYRDEGGVLTIGYGHCGPDVSEGLIITKDKAMELLRKDLQHFETGVILQVEVPINDNEFSALVSFSYNLGLGSLKASALLEKLNDNEPKINVANEFPKWCHIGRDVSEGLLRRRNEERTLFLK